MRQPALKKQARATARATAREQSREKRSLFVKSRYQCWVPELMFFLSAIALYTYQLGTESFWIDEILSVESAQGKLNLNRPLYFILLRFWMRISTNGAWLRSLSLFNLYSVLTVGTYCSPAYLSTEPILKRPNSSEPHFGDFFPIFSIFALAQLHPILREDRYALISAPYILSLLAAAWAQLWQKHRTIALPIALIYLLTVSRPLLRYYTTDYRADWQGLAQQLSHCEQPGEPVIVYPGSFVETMNDDDDGTANLLPIEDVITAEDVEPDEIVKIALNTNNKRLWVVCPVVEQWHQEKDSLVKKLEKNGFVLQQSSYLIDQWNWGATLHLFIRTQ